MTALLQAHLAKEWNVCRYFGPEENDVFCFNLDNNHKTNNTELIPELAAAVRNLERILRDAGIAPLIVASGRGYHAWCRLERPLGNERLHGFMRSAAVRSLLPFQGTELDYRRVKYNFYPDPRSHDVVSLRLFGSEHAKNKVFSHVLSDGRLMDEADSWSAFERFMAHGSLSESAFESACSQLLLVPKGGLEPPCF